MSQCEMTAIFISSPLIFGLVIITLFSVLREKKVVIGVKIIVSLIKLLSIVFGLGGLLLLMFGDSNELKKFGMLLFMTAQSFAVVAISTLPKK